MRDELCDSRSMFPDTLATFRSELDLKIGGRQMED